MPSRRSILAASAALLLLTGTALAADEAAPSAADTGGISPEAVGIIIAAALGVGGGSYAAGRAHTVRVTPQPLQVEEAKEYATREELKRLEEQHEREVENINKRIDTLTLPLAEIKGKIDVINRNQEQILNLLLNK